MVVSRDVTFDEKKTWQWTSTNETLLEQPGTFKIMFLGDHGNQGIRDDDNDGEETEQSSNDVSDAIEEETEQSVSNDDEGEDGAEGNALRRSTRVSKKPGYLEDYVCLVEAEGECLLLLINEERYDFEDAIKEKVWRDAC